MTMLATLEHSYNLVAVRSSSKGDPQPKNRDPPMESNSGATGTFTGAGTPGLFAVTQETVLIIIIV